jgi:solute carrier family 25 carnitine/acylcarnitine transporter 20/29
MIYFDFQNMQAVGYPFDIIKTRIQATTVLVASSEGGTSVPGVLETAKQLVVEANGNIMRGLYRGFGLKLVRSIPASMIGFLTYEVVSKELTRD